MTNPVFLTPVAEDDPCGPNLRWDSDFLALNDAFAAAVAQGETAVVEGETIASPEERAFDGVLKMAASLSARTKDLRVLAIHAEASWYYGGLVAFASAMEDLAAVQETWPGERDGVHPRGDDDDGDLGERAAALGRLLHRIPTLAATVGWGERQSDAEMLGSVATLRGVFGAWTARFEDAFRSELPSSGDAWRALGNLIGAVGATAEDTEGNPRQAVALQSTDAWDLIDQALQRMIEQDHHSPALPVLRLLSSWRALGIIDIVDRMRGSGVTLEQLMESVKKQTQ